MKGLGANCGHLLSNPCDPMIGPREPMYAPTADLQASYLHSPTLDHYGTLDLQHFPPSSPTSLPPECLFPLSKQLSLSGTFPRIHYDPLMDQADPGSGIGGGIHTRMLSTSISMGTETGTSLSGVARSVAGSTATISAGSKIKRLPGNLLERFEKKLPAACDGFSTLQFHRSRIAKQRSESPGRIRHFMHSVQKLFAKSQSLESSMKSSNVNGSSNTTEDIKNRQNKSKDRAKTEGAKRRPRSSMSGLWSSEDKLDDNASAQMGSGYSNPAAMTTLSKPAPDSQGPVRHIPQGYNTIGGHMLKSSKSNNELKSQACPALPGPDNKMVKRGSWSTLTLSQARQVCQRGLATMDRSLLKSKSCHQELTYRYLQVPLGDWSSTLGRPRGASEIPCRRMRSGSYVKAIGDLEDSEDSEGSPKPSPKTTARRQSYLKATQPSLSDQLPLHNCLPSVLELSSNRSLDNLDNLDCIDGLVSSPFQRWDNLDFSQNCSTLARTSCTAQVREPEVGRLYVEPRVESVYGQTRSQRQPLDLPVPTCFRSRSHSYLRAIQAGCSQDDDTASVDSESPPPTTTVHTYSSSTLSTCISTCKRAPPPVPPRTTSRPFISVTVQSSTESAHDTYLNSQDHMKVNSQSRFSLSCDSLTSTGASGLAMGHPVATPVELPSPSSPPMDPKHDILKITTSAQMAHDIQTDPEPKRKLSSIGIQVDCIQPFEKQDTPPLTRFQSIGVQVEDGLQPSPSSCMVPMQETDSDTQYLPNTIPSKKNMSSKPVDSPALSPQDNSDGEVLHPLTDKTTASQSCPSSPEGLDPALDPSSLPPPDPWLESGNGSAPPDPSPAGMSACRRDGHWFLKLLQAERARMEGWCNQMEQETRDHQLTEEVLGKVRSAVGSAQLLMSQKFQQFQGLCEQNLNDSASPRPNAQDLAGFWDLLQLSIEDISLKFDELYHLKSNEWQLNNSPEKKEEKKQPPPVPKKPSKAKVAAGREKAAQMAAAREKPAQVDPSSDKQRQEARKRLMAAKRAASERQNSATESADSIEIYVPEAQTRL